MASKPPSKIGRLYRLSLILLPPHARRADGEEMVRLFEALWVDARTWSARLRLVVGAFGRLPGVALTEWRAVWVQSRTGPAMPWAVGRHLRLAVRSLGKAPLFTAMSVILIGLGIGSVTTVFTLVDHVLLRPLPYPEPERLVFVGDGKEPDQWVAHAGPVIRAMQEIDAIDAWAIANSEPANLTGEGVPSRITAAVVSKDFFRVFGATAAMGRLLDADDFPTADRAVLSHLAWTQHLGADPDIIGKTIRVENQPLTVVGVLTPDFQPPQALVAGDVDVWHPIDWALPFHERIDAENLEVVGRLAPGMSREAAQVRFDAVAAELAQLHPDRFLVEGEVVPLPLLQFHDMTVWFVRTELYLLFGAVALLLLIAALNVAHLFLARGVGRVHEMAMRRALGASVGTLVRQLLAESLVVAAAGCALGVTLSSFALDVLLRMNPTSLPVGGPIAIDLPVLGFAIGVSFVTALVFGLIPALRSTNHEAVAGRSRGSTDSARTKRVRDALVVAEVALSVLIVTQAGLLFRSFVSASTPDAGLDPEHVVAVQLRDPGAETREAFVETMNAVRTSIEEHPAVASAAYGMNLPFELTGGLRGGWSNRFTMVADGKERPQILLRQMPVSPSYLRALGIPLLGGEPWSERDGVERLPPVNDGSGGERRILPVMLSRGAAVHFFGDPTRAVGSLMYHADAPERVWLVTGVAGDVRHWGLDQPVPNTLFLPTYTMPRRRRAVTMAVRFRGAPPANHPELLRDAVWRVAPDVPVSDVVPLASWIEHSTAGRRFDSLLFGLFAATGLLLAAAGVYGSLLFAVHQRNREMGIRLALGATPSTLHRHVLGSGVRLAVVGLAIGLLASMWSGKFLRSRLYEVGASDPATFVAAGSIIMLTVVLASWLPARRAGRSDPLESLKAR